MKKVLWLSQHRPLEVQLGALRQMLGADTEVVQEARPIRDAREIVREYRRGGYDDMVIVAPLSVIAVVVDEGVRPLWSQMQQVEQREGADITYRGRHYRFERFRRIRQVAIEFED